MVLHGFLTTEKNVNVKRVVFVTLEIIFAVHDETLLKVCMT
jgi:hypothetical protein